MLCATCSQSPSHSIYRLCLLCLWLLLDLCLPSLALGLGLLWRCLDFLDLPQYRRWDRVRLSLAVRWNGEQCKP